MTNTSSEELLALAEGLTDEQRRAILAARLMRSGRYRIPWAYPEMHVVRAMSPQIWDTGGYLSALGVQVAASLRATAIRMKEDNHG